MSTDYQNPSELEPDVVQFTPPARRGPGRPKGSKNRNKMEPDFPAVRPPEPEGEAPPMFREEAPRERPIPREERREETLRAWEAHLDAEAQRRLGEVDFSEYGYGRRAKCIVLRDVSPSTQAYDRDFTAGMKEATEEIARSPVARNLTDCFVIDGADAARLAFYAPGRLEFPARDDWGRGTMLFPWLRKIADVVLAHEDHMRSIGRDVAETLCVIASDFMVDDFDPEQPDPAGRVRAFKAWCREHKVVLVAGMYGEADEAVAARIGAPIPPVNLDKVPLKIFLRTLARTQTASMARPGALESMLASALAGLNPTQP